ncbi:MAG: type VI secretion system protein TssA [Magnetovibrionaceae bacterium]
MSTAINNDPGAALYTDSLVIPEVQLDTTLDVDLEAILKGFDGEDGPCGPSLRYSLEMDTIREAGRADDPTLPQGIWQTSLKQADWREVRKLSLDVLLNKSKDLQVAAYLLEALIHLHGFAGAVRGLEVMATLCETYWDDLHPLIEGTDLDFRTAPIEWVNEKLPVALQRVPVTNPKTGDDPPYCWVDWDKALRMENQALKHKKSRAQIEKEIRVTRAQVNRGFTLTETPWLQSALGLIRKADEQASRLETWMDEACGRDAPSLTQFRGALKQIDELVAHALNERGESETAPEPNLETEEQSETPVPQEDAAMVSPDGMPEASTPASGPITSRAEAYRRLSEAADFLIKTEPHSPVPYLVKRAVAWGSLPLGELLTELVSDKSDLAKTLSILGIPGGGDKKG